MNKLTELMSVTGIERPEPRREAFRDSGDCSDQCSAPGDDCSTPDDCDCNCAPS